MQVAPLLDSSLLTAVRQGDGVCGLCRRRRPIPFKSWVSRRGWPIPFKEGEKPVDDGRRAWRGQASPLPVRHDRSVKRQGAARLALATPYTGPLSAVAPILTVLPAGGPPPTQRKPLGNGRLQWCA